MPQTKTITHRECRYCRHERSSTINARYHVFESPHARRRNRRRQGACTKVGNAGFSQADQGRNLLNNVFVEACANTIRHANVLDVSVQCHVGVARAAVPERLARTRRRTNICVVNSTGMRLPSALKPCMSASCSPSWVPETRDRRPKQRTGARSATIRAYDRRGISKRRPWLQPGTAQPWAAPPRLAAREAGAPFDPRFVQPPRPGARKPLEEGSLPPKHHSAPSRRTSCAKRICNHGAISLTRSLRH